MAVKLAPATTMLELEALRQRAEDLGLHVGKDGHIDQASMKNVKGGAASIEALADQGALDAHALGKLKAIQPPKIEPTETAELTQEVKSLALALDGLSSMLAKDTDREGIAKRARKVVHALDDAIPSADVLGRASPAAVEKLAIAIADFAEVGNEYLAKLAVERNTAYDEDRISDARAIEEFAGGILSLQRFAQAALTTPSEAGTLALADTVGAGHLSGRAEMQVAQAIEYLKAQTGMSGDDVASAFRWYLGRMSEIGFKDPPKYYQAIAQGDPRVDVGRISDRAMYAIGVLVRVAHEQEPTDAKSFIDAISSSIEVRTSETHPLQVAWVETNTPGKLGLTLAPGKQQPSLFSYIWERDLDTDLKDLRQKHGVDLIVPLIEDHELETLGIKDLVQSAKKNGMDVVRFPIPDQDVPDKGQAIALADDIIERLKKGENVLVHCKGGLGRAGTITATTLIRLGGQHEAVIDHVRSVRPGAVENKKQEDFLASLDESAQAAAV
jgi:protein-tyrosine phosphatase